MDKLSMSEEEMLKRKYTRPYEKRIADLEKENAEAKEIIKKLLSRLNRLTYTGLNCEECKEAEQFLKDSEVEK